MVLNASLFVQTFQDSLLRFGRHFLLWLVMLMPATLPSILLNTLAWHEVQIGHYIISTYSLETFKLLDNISYILIFFGIWVYWVAAILAMRDLNRDKPARPGHLFLEAIRLIPKDLYLKVVLGIKILLWSLCLVVPGFYKGVLYSLAKYSMIEKDMHPVKAVEDSHDLLKGKFVGYLDYLLYIILIVGFVFIVQKLFIDQVYNIFLLADIQSVLRWIENFVIVFTGLCHVFVLIFLHNLYLRLDQGK